MQAARREARQMRWQVWHTAALPLMKRFPDRDRFIDPERVAAIEAVPGASTFLALRAFGGDAAPDWVLEKFGLKPSTQA